jgi:AraC-like DNA-binding protein
MNFYEITMTDSSKMLSKIALNIKIKILNVGFKSQDTSLRAEKILNPFSRLYLITRGDLCVFHDKNQYNLKANTLHIIPCFEPCTFSCPQSFECYYLHFTSRVYDGMDIFALQNYQYSVPAGKRQKSLFKRLLELIPDKDIKEIKTDGISNTTFKVTEDSYSSKSAADIIESQGIVMQLLAPILRTAQPHKEPSAASGFRRFWGVMEYIDDNIGRENLTLGDIAQHAELNPTYFSNVFYKLSGIRPIEYLNKKRIQKAEVLLLSNSASIQKIAAMVGFKEPSYFSRVFKKYTGISPIQFRRGEPHSSENLTLKNS